MNFKNQIEKNVKEQKRHDQEPSLFKQSAYFQHEKKMDPFEMRFQQMEDKIQQFEEMNSRKFEHLEERVRQVNQKFDRIEQLGERLESLNKLIDTLKSNFDAKLMVFEDKYQQQNSKIDKKISTAIEKLRIDQNEQSRRTKNESVEEGELIQMVKRSIQIQKELQYEVCLLKQNFGSRDVRQSDIILNKKQLDIVPNGILKQSNIINGSSQGTLQSPTNNQRLDSFKIQQQQQQRVRSMTLEKQHELEQQKLRSRNESSNAPLNTEEDEEKKQKTRPKKQEELVDKYQFTLQSKNPNQQQEENQAPLQTSKSQQVQFKQSFVNSNTNFNVINSMNSNSNANMNMNSTGNMNFGLQEQRDRTQSKGTIQSRKDFEKGKAMPQSNEVGKTQLERAVSQDSFARSKYLTNERVSGQFKAVENVIDSKQQPIFIREQQKNLRK